MCEMLGKPEGTTSLDFMYWAYDGLNVDAFYIAIEKMFFKSFFQISN